MKWTNCIFVLALFLLGVSGHARDRHSLGMAPVSSMPPLGVSIVLESKLPLADEVLDGMEKELRQIFAQSTVSVDLVLPNLESHPVFATEVIMARIVGKCRVDAVPPLHAHKPDTLGRTMVTDGRILPFMEIDCAQISGAVRRQLVGKPSSERSRLLGRAAARVLAHEVYHVMAQTHAHGRWGIAAESLTGEDLLREHLSFRVEDLESMGLASVMATH